MKKGFSNILILTTIIVLLIGISGLLIYKDKIWPGLKRESSKNRTFLPEEDKSPPDSSNAEKPSPKERAFSYDIFTEPGGEVLVIFKVAVPEWTPVEDQIYLSIDVGGFTPTSHPMKKNDGGYWIVGIKFKKNSEIGYRYERNGYGFMTSEQFNPDADTFRKFSLAENALTIQDKVSGWRWLLEKKPEAEISKFVPETIPPREERLIIGIALWDYNDPVFDLYTPLTFERIKEAGFEYIQLPYFSSYEKSLNPVEFTENEEAASQTRRLTNEAKKHGLNVIWWLAVQENWEGTAKEPDIIDRSWVQEYILQKSKFVVRAAEEAERLGVSVIVYADEEGFDYSSEEVKQYASGLMIEMINDIKSVYSGKVTTDTYWEEGLDYNSALDWLGAKWPYPLTDKKDARIEEMREEAEKIIDEVFEKAYEKYKKPFFFQAGYASYDGAAGANQMNTEGPELSERSPYNDNFPTDFQEQADAFEAFFQAIYDEQIFIGASAFGYGYWTMHDKSFGIRDKPAEDIWIKWNNILE